MNRIDKLKKEYKKSIANALKNIHRNIDDIVENAFKNSTRNITISINIEPGELVTWDYIMTMNVEPIMQMHEEDNNDETD